MSIIKLELVESVETGEDITRDAYRVDDDDIIVIETAHLPTGDVCFTNGDGNTFCTDRNTYKLHLARGENVPALENCILDYIQW